MLDLLLETARSLRAHSVRFGLTALGVAWGAFMLTYLTASMEGMQRHFHHELSELGPDLVFLGGGRILKDRIGERGTREVALEDDDVARFRALYSIEALTPVVTLRSRVVRAGGRTRLLNVEGVDASAERIRNLPTQYGRFLTPLDIQRTARVAVIGPGAAERLFGHRQVVGRTLQLESLRLRIVGVSIDKGEQLMDSGDLDDLKLWIPWSTAQRWYTRDDRIHEFVFQPAASAPRQASVRAIRQIAGLHHGFAPDVEPAIWSFDTRDALGPIFGSLVALRVFVAAAGAITLLVGAVGVMNIMLVVVAERTREIGLRKALGATSRDIFVQFLAEAVSVSSSATLLGAALGIGLTQLVGTLVPEGSPLQSVPATDPATVIAIVATLIAVAIVAGVAPALRAARITPAEALRAS